MASTTEADVDVIEHLERLALIKFSQEERDRLKKELRKIIEFFDQLRELGELKNIEPLFHVLDIESPLRDDEPRRCEIPQNELLSGAEIEQGYVKAPRTISG
ncbi:MAG: Asp-tRNA(Asn)/Glu-tRNA(Gln) amidotransferase GatCAB subunit C [Thermoprotei archaeon]|nr:MAG: Asp-tRNA(Asn)/Glu-tRNA(Gln) amidotransferase GatCAB subunit C [Thermoprotei archaeon]